MADDDGAPDGKPKEPKDQKRREQILVAAAVGGVILTVLLIKRTSANASASQQPAATPAYLPGSAGSPGSYSGGVASSDFYSLEAQVQGLSQQLSDLRGATGSSSPTPLSTNPTSPDQVFLGTGWAPKEWQGGANLTTEAPIPGAGGGMFQWIPSVGASQAISASGQDVYIEPTPGNFIKDPGGEKPGSAAQFVKIT